jgi:hypothetical protein
MHFKSVTTSNATTVYKRYTIEAKLKPFYILCQFSLRMMAFEGKVFLLHQCTLATRGTPIEKLDCKRPILWLASSKKLNPHPPHRSASVYPPPLVRGEDTLAGWTGGWGGGSIF